MIIAAQIVMMITLILFTMGAIADNNIENRKIWSLVVVINLVSLTVSFTL